MHRVILNNRADGFEPDARNEDLENGPQVDPADADSFWLDALDHVD